MSLTLEWERRVTPLVGFPSHVPEWVLVTQKLDPNVTAFEAHSMAAGLRAEGKNIRDVRIREETIKTRWIL